MKRLAIAVLSCLILLLAACDTVGIGGGGRDAREGSSEWSGTLRIAMFTPGSGWPHPYRAGMEPVRVRMIQERMKEFMELHPGVEIEVIDIPGGKGNVDDVLNDPELAPDIVELTPYQAVTMYADRLLDLEDWIGQENLWPGPYGELISRMTPEGHAVLLPTRVDPAVVYYDPAKFAELGLKEPEEGWTILDYAEAGRRLMEAGYGAYFPAAVHYTEVEGLIRSLGGRYMSPDGREVIGWLDSEETIEAFVRYTQLIPEEASPKRFNLGRNLAVLGIGHAASLWQLIELKHAEYSVGPLPKAQDGERLNAAKTSGFAVMRDSGQQALAWEFLKWLIGKTDEEALEFAAMNMLDTFHEPFITSENKSIVALREQTIKEIAYSVPASFYPYMARPGYLDESLPYPSRSWEEYVTYRDRETARRELTNLAKEWEEWMAAAKNAVPR